MSVDAGARRLSAAAEAVVLLLKAHDAIRAAMEASMRERLGVGTGSYDVLRALSEAPQRRLRMVDLADRVCISRSGVTQSVDRLEHLGLVVRATDRDDRRLVYAEITPAGCALVPAGRCVMEELGERFVTRTLTGPQTEQLTDALEAVAGISVAAATAACPATASPTTAGAAGAGVTARATATSRGAAR